MKYLVCELNDYNYTDPVFTIADSLDKAREICNTACKEWEDSYSEYELEEFTKLDTINGKNVWRQDNHLDDSFYVTEVHEFDETLGEWLCVWHHAYNGVDFDICCVGNQTQCIKYMHKNAREVFEDTDMDAEITEEDFEHIWSITIDTGEEWEHWEIVHIL